MPAFAIANLSKVQFGEEIAEYLRRIDDTLVPFKGTFCVHGASPEVVEGRWAEATVIIEFPDLDHARAWYQSPAYQEILPLRTRNSEGSAILIDGVDPGYRASSLLAKLGL
ncbi:MAG TPA: DUF1330 domain-containing protein [Burkholderiaceae bacterium]|nr:DUF1330 domain-containing protein [Burkholderiaceae bacterium]